MEGETRVFVGELVGMVDAAVTAIAEGGFVGGAVKGGLLFLTHIALNLHLIIYLCIIMESVIGVMSERDI